MFDFDYQPTLLNVRHLFTSIGNILLPERSNNGSENAFVSTTALTEKSGHTQSTGRRSYGTWMENADEVFYDFYHKELGEEILEPPRMDFTPFTTSILKKSLKKLLGGHATFWSSQQQEMIGIASNSIKRHAFMSLPCGQGKSMSWLVPVMASLLSGRHVGLRIVILPYKFLLAHMVEQAKSLFGPTLNRIQVEFADSSTLNNDSIPTWMDENNLPTLLFLNLDAAEKLLRYHMDRLQRWAHNSILKRIYFDEFQQIIVEYGFRKSYQSLRKLGRVGVPVMCLSGSLPLSTAMSLMKYCCLSTEEDNNEIDTVEAIDPIGDGFTFDIQIVESVSESVVELVSKITKDACHVICETKKICVAIAAGLSMKCKILTVTGDSSSVEQSNCAKAWFDGSHDVLVSTIVALIGNENRRCKTIVIAGFLYNISNLVQAIGRLRPEQRGLDSIVQIFRLPLRTRDHDDAQTKSMQDFHAMRSENCLNNLPRDDYLLLFSSWGLHKFFKKNDCCYLQTLSSYFKFDRQKCNLCGFCRQENNAHTILNDAGKKAPGNVSTKQRHESNGNKPAAWEEFSS